MKFKNIRYKNIRILVNYLTKIDEFKVHLRLKLTFNFHKQFSTSLKCNHSAVDDVLRSLDTFHCAINYSGENVYNLYQRTDGAHIPSCLQLQIAVWICSRLQTIKSPHFPSRLWTFAFFSLLFFFVLLQWIMAFLLLVNMIQAHDKQWRWREF